MLVTVVMPREKWTDGRLDDLGKAVDDLRAETREGFARVHADIRDLHRILIGGLFVVIAAIIGSNAF
jgi:hypothetical protein